MSPLPTMPPHHHQMQSPGYGSPGMMPMSFPSPSQQQRGKPTSGESTPGRHQEGGLPYIPPQQAYDGENQGSGEGGSEGKADGGDAASSRVEQRRNPDGSMSISIGGQQQGGSEGESGVNISDVSHLLLDNYEEGGGGGQPGDAGPEEKTG